MDVIEIWTNQRRRDMRQGGCNRDWTNHGFVYIHRLLQIVAHNLMEKNSGYLSGYSVVTTYVIDRVRVTSPMSDVIDEAHSFNKSNGE